MVTTEGGIGPETTLEFFLDSFAGYLGWSYTLTQPGFKRTSGPFPTLELAKRDAIEANHLNLSASPIKTTIKDTDLMRRIQELEAEVSSLREAGEQ